MVIKLFGFILVIFVFQVFGNSSPVKICLENEGLTEEEAEKLFNQRTSNDIAPKLKCFATCIVESMNLLDGCNLRYEEVKQNWTMERKFAMIVALDECKDSVQGNERCECGYQVFSCLDDYHKKYINQ